MGCRFSSYPAKCTSRVHFKSDFLGLDRSANRVDLFWVIHSIESGAELGFRFGFRLMRISKLGSPEGERARPLVTSVSSTLPQTNMEAPRTPLEDLVPFTEAFWELPCLRECTGLMGYGCVKISKSLQSCFPVGVLQSQPEQGSISAR